MKKIICCLMIGILCLHMFVGCGKQNENNPTNGTENSEQTVNVLREMEPVNQADALQSRYGKVAYRDYIYNADGTMLSYYFYKDQKLHAHVSGSEYALIDETGDVYGFYADEGVVHRYLFVGDYYEKVHHDMYNYLVGYRYEGEYETVLTQVTKNGIIDIETEITDKEMVNAYIGRNGYEEDSATKILICYQVEEETYVINKIIGKAVFADGTQKVLLETVREEDVETYVPDEKLTKAVFEGDLKTLTVTVDAGTDKEKVYTQTISKGNCILLCLPESYDQTSYLDAEYTTKYDKPLILESDLHIYVRSKSE